MKFHSIVLSLCLGAFAGTGSVYADTVEDYLVQSVCVDALDIPTATDPVLCPHNSRKLKVGEVLPYHKWDMPTQSPLAQISDSYPIADLYGRKRVVSTFFFARGGSVPFFAPGNSATGDSAYDLIVTDGTYASIAGTYDMGAGWQPVWRNSSCSLSDSWVIAPKSQAIPFTQGSTVSNLTLSFPNCPTVDSVSSSLTIWDYYGDYLYQSGKRLGTVKSFHFSSNSLNSDALEMFMFTKEYGKTKWEAWKSSAQVSGPSATAVSRCGVGTNGGVVIFGVTTYYLVDCHDWSFIFPAASGGWDPAQFHIDPLFYSVNLLKNTHMQCTNAGGVARVCGSPAVSCQTTAPWGRLGVVNWSFSPNPQAPVQSANCSLRFSTPTTPVGQSVYQDSQGALPAYTQYSYGVALKAPESTGTQLATIAIHQLNSSGGVISTHSVDAHAGQNYRIYKGNFTKNPGASKFRFEIYLKKTNVVYEMTDAWVAPVP